MNKEPYTLTIEASGSALFFVTIYLIVWLCVFVGHLKRTNYESSDRVIWTITLLIPIIGLILYMGLSGKPLQQEAESVGRNKKLTDRTLKDAEDEANLKKKLNAKHE